MYLIFETGKIDTNQIRERNYTLMATIQWFPGHMSKARRQVQENLKFVDFVTVLVDARLPLSSQNPMLTKIIGDKPRLLILNKADLADPILTKEWRQHF